VALPPPRGWLAAVADTIERLARIAGMLGSAHEGERATAAEMASAMLKAMGLTWSEVIRRGLSAATSDQAHQRHAPANETHPTSDRGSSGSRGHQARGGDWGSRDWRARTRERNGVPAWKWVDALWKQEGRLTDWDRQYLRCLRGLGKNLTLTTAQWSCIESIADSIGWRPKG
jgi:hypothetical protein